MCGEDATVTAERVRTLVQTVVVHAIRRQMTWADHVTVQMDGALAES